MGPAGKTRADVVGVDFVAKFNQSFLIPEGWARADEAHLSHENVEDLWEFVEAEFAENFADFGDVLFGVCQFVGREVGGVDFHGAEFEDIEVGFVFAETFLFEEDGSRVGDEDDEGDEEHRYKKYDDSESGEKEVE